MSVEDLSPTQIARFREAFNLFDRDGDGVIDAKDLGTCMRSCGATPTEFQIKVTLHAKSFSPPFH